MKFESKNPLLNNKAFSKGEAVETLVYDAEGNPVEVVAPGAAMTINGTINKSVILFLLLFAGAFTTWYMIVSGYNPLGFMIGGLVVGFILSLAVVFKPRYSPVLAPAYALFEGLAIGGLSALMEMRYPGIVIQAVGGTFITFIVCLALYRFRIVKVNNQFRSIVIAATLAIATYYVVSMILSFAFGMQLFHHGSSLPSIGFSIFVIAIAAMNLFLDFDLIEDGAQRRLPKYMEWFGAFGLMVTLIWLYVEFLRLLSKLSSRD